MCVGIVASSTEEMTAQSIAYHAHGTADGDKYCCYPWLVCHDIKSAMHPLLAQARPRMINHLTSLSCCTLLLCCSCWGNNDIIICKFLGGGGTLNVGGKSLCPLPSSHLFSSIWNPGVSYRILSWEEKHGGSRMIVACESTLTHV